VESGEAGERNDGLEDILLGEVQVEQLVKHLDRA
jgi:hypothetical protein